MNDPMPLSPLLVILEEVAHRYSTPVSQLQSSDRSSALSVARGEYAYLALMRTPTTLTAIGRRINRSRHTVASLVLSFCELHKVVLPRELEWNSLKGKRMASRTKKASMREHRG